MRGAAALVVVAEAAAAITERPASPPSLIDDAGLALQPTIDCLGQLQREVSVREGCACCVGEAALPLWYSASDIAELV